ncbi:YgfZ/GcvT domain-containing protein [Thauera sp.]|uniref:CAF17-like 4Fe-4S cluster assembly/insertion protein YgfZ n=1 Tax=Thauera sp. TaxID=1905334 RepID=UPI0039E67E14
MTAWTDFLAQQGANLAGHSLRFADPAAEARAVADATIVVPLLHLGTVRSAGPDSAAFIHNLVSNEVQKLAADSAVWNSFNSPKGRMIASFLLWPEADGHSMVLSADILPAFLKKFSMYVLRSKVKLSDASETLVLLGVGGNEAGAVLAGAGLAVPDAAMKQAGGDETGGTSGPRCVRLDERNFIVAVAADAAPALFDALQAAGAVKAGTGAWQLAMIRAGIPLITQPTQEEFVAQMLNYDLIGGVNFKKGCYPGQEIVARTQYLGKLKKRMYRVAAPSGTPQAAAGTDIYAPAFGDQSAGKIVNAAAAADGGFEALAVLQTSSAEAGELHLGSVDGPSLALLDLPYSLG